MATAEANGFGWMPRAWDDDELGACKSDDNWFALTISRRFYATDADLTTFGKTMARLLKHLGVPASIFSARATELSKKWTRRPAIGPRPQILASSGAPCAACGATALPEPWTFGAGARPAVPAAERSTAK